MRSPIRGWRKLLSQRDMHTDQATFDPHGPGVVRLHLVPPKWSWFKRSPWLLRINGYYTLVLHPWQADLLRIFIRTLKEWSEVGQEIDQFTRDSIVTETVSGMSRLYPNITREIVQGDLQDLINAFTAIARGESITSTHPIQTLEQYARYMRAPERMDLAIMPTRLAGRKACRLSCTICYAEGQPGMEVEELLPIATWTRIIDICWEAGVTTLSFTGGEPLAYPHLPELIRHAREFTTRVNTSAVLLTTEYARALVDAELDVLQVTLYSHNRVIHDRLVGFRGGWEETLAGIAIAQKAGLQVAVNIPLTIRNYDLESTLVFLHARGIRYVSCSAIIKAGKGDKPQADDIGLSHDDLFDIVKEGVETATRLCMEFSFTSPGSLSDEELLSLGLNPPVCGACLSNMAVGPDGSVYPCQSAMGKGMSLGTLPGTSWREIWNHPICRCVRKQVSAKNRCPLKAGGVL